MSGIHALILNKVREELTSSMMTAVADTTKAGAVAIGPLQGNPDPDEARISIELYANDPDEAIGSGAGNLGGSWADEVEEVEVGGVTTWRRRFCVKARCLLENTREDLAEALDIASTVRSRIERTLKMIKFGGLSSADEYVSRGVLSEDIRGEMTQSGGPPDSYDFHIKIRFDVLTTERGGL